MKAIELTKEHKSKLLEMCNNLFIDRNWHFWESETESYPDGMIGHCNTIIWGGKSYESVEIHWFEFCMTHLAFKILPKTTFYNLDSAYDSLYNCLYQFWETKFDNPIDYLYEEFKKLKN